MISPQALLITSSLLGAYVFLGGAFGTLYALGRIQSRRAYSRLAIACYVLQLVVMGAVVTATPLAPNWKALLVVSTCAYAIIPSITLRYLMRLHAH